MLIRVTQVIPEVPGLAQVYIFLLGLSQPIAAFTRRLGPARQPCA